MGTIRTRRFHWLKPGTIYTFSVQAVSGASQSDPSTISLKTTGDIGMTWPKNAKITARPVYWSKTIVVKWTQMQEPLRMDNYRLFRKEGSPPTQKELEDWSPSPPYFVKDCGRWAYHTDHLTGTVAGLKGFGQEIEKDVSYYYWVWAFDRSGLPSAKPLGPNPAKFGKPNKPKITASATTVHVINKWWCDFELTWKCPGGCEYYLLQRKLKNAPFWGPVFMVQHDEDAGDDNQKHTFDNLLCGREYLFKVWAVNVPFVFVSDIEERGLKTGQDTERPDEIEGVAARRMFHARKLLGEYVKLTWARPKLALMEQQIDYYRIYRLKGTDEEANAYADKINIDEKADHRGKPKPYSETGRFSGTQFIDDDLETIKPGKSSAPSRTFAWDCEGADDTARKTASTSGGPVEGELYGGAAINTTKPHSGSYALSLEESSGGIYFYLPEASRLNGNEGYLGFYVYGEIRGSSGGNGGGAGEIPIFELFHFDDELGRINIYIAFAGSGNVSVIRRLDTGSHTAAISGLSESPAWHHIEARWSVENNYLSINIGSGWVEADTSTPLTSYDEDVSIVSISRATSATYFDEIGIVTMGPPVETYYHYWVTAVDSIGLESKVSAPRDKDEGTPSYDKVSFSPPPKPVVHDVEWNTALNILSTKLMVAKFSWDAIDEATHFRVSLRSRPLGTKKDGKARDYTAWFSSPYLREEAIDNPDKVKGGKYYTWPFPFLQGQKIEYSVKAYNAAGESPYDKIEATVGPDIIPPTEIQNLWGRCFGMYSLLLRKLWIGVKLTWDDLPSYEGVKLYQVEIYNPLTHKWEFATNAHPSVGNMKVMAWDPGPPIADSHRYRVRAIDWDYKRGDPQSETYHAGPWKEIEIKWLQWWKFATE